MAKRGIHAPAPPLELECKCKTKCCSLDIRRWLQNKKNIRVYNSSMVNKYIYYA